MILKQINLIHRYRPNRNYLSESVWNKVMGKKRWLHTSQNSRTGAKPSPDNFTFTYIYIYIYIYKVGQSYSIATTPRCRTQHLSLDCSTYLDPHLIMLNVKQEGRKYHFSSRWYDTTWAWTPVTGPLAIWSIWCSRGYLLGELLMPISNLFIFTSF